MDDIDNGVSPLSLSESPLASWTSHAKHIFIVTSAGKPVWSRWGDDAAQAALAPIVQAVCARADDGGDPLSSITLGDGAVFVVLSKGPLLICAVSRTREPISSLNAQLRAVWSYLTFATLPTATIVARLTSRPGADVRGAVIGAAKGLRAVISGAARSPSLWLDAFPMLALPAGSRARASTALARGGSGGSDAIAAAGARLLYTVLIAGDSLVAWAGPPRTTGGVDDASLRATDAACLITFTGSAGAALCAGGRVACVPIAMPALSATATVTAIVIRLDAATVALTSSSSLTSPTLSTPTRILYEDSSPTISDNTHNNNTMTPVPLMLSPLSLSPIVVSPLPVLPQVSSRRSGWLNSGINISFAPPPPPTSASIGTPRTPLPSLAPLPSSTVRTFFSSPLAVPDDTLDDVSIGGGGGEGMNGGGAGVYLVLVAAGVNGSENGGAAADAVALRGDAIARALRDAGSDRDACTAINTPTSFGGAALGDLPAYTLHNSLGLQIVNSHLLSRPTTTTTTTATLPSLSLLHYIFLHKTSRQMTSSAWMTGFCGNDRMMKSRRKALLRALAHAYDAVTAPVPLVRHYISAFSSSEKTEIATIIAIAAINTSGVIVLGVWGTLGGDGGGGNVIAPQQQPQVLPTDRIAGLMEKLAKVIGKDTDRLFLLPGPLPIA